MRLRVVSAFVLASCGLIVGCGGGDASGVSGAVTYNGEPVEDGYVTFSPTGSGNSFGAKVVDGQYAAKNDKAGQFTVLVQGNRIDQVPKTREEAERIAKAQAGKPPQSPNYIPEDAEGNNQTVEITGGEQTLDFALTGPPRQ
jgi:hypothetical protein